MPRAKPTTNVPKRSGPGRPEFVPTPADRALVLALSGYGIPHDDIAALVKNPDSGEGISPMTLRKCFQRELTDGVATANSKVVGALFKNATTATPAHPGGIPVSQIFWLKCRAGWQKPEPEAPPPAKDPDALTRLEVVRRIAFALTISQRGRPKIPA